MRREIKSPKRQMRLENFKVTGTSTAALGEGQYQATLVDNGTGDYTLTFDEAFGRTPTAVATTITAESICLITALSTTAVTVKTYDATDGTTAKDADFYLHVMGSDVADEQ